MIERQTEASLADPVRIVAAIATVTAALAERGSMGDILGRCAGVVARGLDAAMVRVWTVDEARGVLRLQATAGPVSPPDDARAEVPIGHLDIGRIASERLPHATVSLADDVAAVDRKWALREGLTGFAGHALVAEDRLVGILAVWARHPLSDVATQAVAAMAGALAVGIGRQRAGDALREQVEVVEAITRVGHLLAGELDLQRVVQAVTDAATELSGARFGSFFYNVLDDRGASYMLYCLSGVPREAFAHFPMPRATDLFGPTVRGEGTIRIADVKADPRYGNNSPYFGMPPGHLPVTSYLAVPVMSRSGEVLGGLFFGHPDPSVFTARVERTIEILAIQAGVAIDNVRLYEAQRKARSTAEEASRLKDLFLATVSHELRAPLNAMLGWTYLMRTGTLSEEDTARALETVERNARAQNQLIEDLLDVSGIISGKLRLDVRPVALISVIEAALETVRLSAEAKSVRLQAALDPAAGPVKGDPDRLQQVVWNLLSNAIKFTPKGGRVQIQLERVSSHVEIVVRDTGVGIQPGSLPYVFDRFWQQDASSTRRPHGGLGLGLAIVRHLVELHGGTAHADSAGPDRGATFTVELPLMPTVESPSLLAAEHPTAGGKVPLAELPSLAGVRALVIDDEPSAREIVTAILVRGGAHVRAAASAAEALAEFTEWRPDVLVSDIEMPGEDGYSLIRRIRRLDAAAGRQTPAVALTAYARVQDRLRALSAGYQIHVPKPVEPIELLTVIASLTGRIADPRG